MPVTRAVQLNLALGIITCRPREMVTLPCRLTLGLSRHLSPPKEYN